MESLVIKFSNIKGKKVLLTGHDGFKGTWLVGILKKLDCEVLGISDFKSESREFFLLTDSNILEEKVALTNQESLNQIFYEFNPDIVIHMAAQPLVRQSYDYPVLTWQSNVVGTLNILETCRNLTITPEILIITTDKVYKNNGWQWGYRENDELGGQDPYSASKSACEILVRSYRKSYENLKNIIVVRGGNVIGGGDFSSDRLMPDLYRNSINSVPTIIRSPNATRPWQHVLDCLDGYLTVLDKHISGSKGLSHEYNIGPDIHSNKTVLEFIEAVNEFDKIKYSIQDDNNGKESNFLYLDSSRVFRECNWIPSYDFTKSIEMTCDWYFSKESLKNKVFNHQLDTHLTNV
jgi:CDP-glucose 4,6-dehydratase